MKRAYFLFVLAMSSSAFSQDAFEAMQQKIEKNPDRFFFNGKSYAKLAKDANGNPLYKVEKKGTRLPQQLAYYGLWKLGEIPRTLIDDKHHSVGQTITFELTTEAGVKDSFVCFLIDMPNCGKHYLEGCTKSKLGYSVPKGYHTYEYNPSLNEQCNSKEPAVSQDERSPSKNVPHANDKKSIPAAVKKE